MQMSTLNLDSNNFVGDIPEAWASFKQVGTVCDASSCRGLVQYSVKALKELNGRLIATFAVKHYSLCKQPKIMFSPQANMLPGDCSTC